MFSPNLKVENFQTFFTLAFERVLKTSAFFEQAAGALGTKWCNAIEIETVRASQALATTGKVKLQRRRVTQNKRTYDKTSQPWIWCYKENYSVLSFCFVWWAKWLHGEVRVRDYLRLKPVETKNTFIFTLQKLNLHLTVHDSVVRPIIEQVVLLKLSQLW